MDVFFGISMSNRIGIIVGSELGLVTVIILGIALGVILGIVMLVPLLFYFKRRDMMRHKKIIMVSPNARDVQLGDPMIHQQQDSYLTTNTADIDNHHNSNNDRCQQYDCEEKSTFLDEGRTGYGGWYSSSSTSTIQQQGKTTCCPNLLLMSSPPLLQSQQLQQPQTLIPQNDIWPICPVQHKQQQQFLLQQQHEKQHNSNNNNFNINNDNNNNNNNVSVSMYMSKCPILNDHLDHDYDLPK
ncbi:hypothetical protein HELRODRAFT_161908 [Helobdella robusta]|uniref:Uncharacterized protein n=1 Tax=Helobdella robusta TaxID=6412 RepID=T1ES12_HELRO|nr:hypothetical protein HELRODRAFT_161908 [Helobdella robusta]ESO02620.1 hypothetical protein HELRODRAFT_161908 [Helobdella robusta]